MSETAEYTPTLTTLRNALNWPLTLDTTGFTGKFVTVHTVAAHAGVNLNRDMDGLPKQITLGGVDRMRISAQARVRAMRTFSRQYIEGTDQATARTRLLPQEIDRHLVKTHGWDPTHAQAAAVFIVTAAGMAIDPADPSRTRATVYLPEHAAKDLADLVNGIADEHSEAIDETDTVSDKHKEAETRAKDGKAKKTKAADLPKLPAAPAKLRSRAQANFAPGACAELALFGRMLSELPDGQVYSSGQIAHTIGVDRMEMIRDDFTVVDDFQDAGVFGAANRGEQYLASGTVYNYAALDRNALRRTLSQRIGDAAELESLAGLAEQMFVTSAVYALPSSKRSRTGPSMLPTMALAYGTDMPFSMAGLFEEAIDGAAAVTASHRIAAHLRRTDRYAPISQGVCRWLPPSDQDAPVFPNTVHVDGDL